MKIQLFQYLHSDKSDNVCLLEEKCEELELDASNEALNNFAYALYEVGFELEVDTDTGEYKIVKIFDGKNVFRAVKE